MLTILLTALLAQATAPAPSPARKQATTLNTRGFRLYQKKQYPEALALFRQASEADPTHALAHYNLAATLGVLRKQRRTCEFDAYKQAIVTELTRAVELDAGRKARMQRDRDFDDVRDTLGYQKLLGLDPKKPADLPALLERVSWYSGGEGAYGSMKALDLQPGGKLTLTLRQLTEDEKQPLKESKLPGTWKLEAGKLTLTFAQPLEGATTVSGTLGETGVLEMEAPLGKLYDRPSECEA